MTEMAQLRERYLRLNGPRPIEGAYLRRIEDELQISLPQAFKEAAEFCDGTGLDVFPLHAFSSPPKTNILSETVRLRESIGLPAKFLVMGEPSESLLVLDCEDGGKVIWCDAIDAQRLGKEPLSREPDTWATFKEFLEQMLDEEEAERSSNES